MAWNLLTSAADDRFRSANLGEAALYAGLGFLIVFVGIAFLIFIVWAVGQLITKFEQKAAKPVKESAPKPEVVAATSEDELSDEVIAVITAAIAAYYQQENKKCEFTVKRIKRL